jgi:uncharacterized membrane protein
MDMTKKKKIHIRLSRTNFYISNPVPRSAIYECSECENVSAFKKGEKFTECENCNPKIDGQYWERTNDFVRFVSKNLNTEYERIEGFGHKIADTIAEFAGNLWFVIFHIIWFGWWIHVNTGHSSFGLMDFDPYPFGLLTMIVSLEAIFLSTFILISQNRQSQKSELRAELDYQTNLNTEKDVAEVLSILRDLKEEQKESNQDAKDAMKDLVAQLEKKHILKRKIRRKTRAEEIIENAGIDNVGPEEEEL